MQHKLQGLKLFAFILSAKVCQPGLYMRMLEPERAKQPFLQKSWESKVQGREGTWYCAALLIPRLA